MPHCPRTEYMFGCRIWQARACCKVKNFTGEKSHCIDWSSSPKHQSVFQCNYKEVTSYICSGMLLTKYEKFCTFYGIGSLTRWFRDKKIAVLSNAIRSLVGDYIITYVICIYLVIWSISFNYFWLVIWIIITNWFELTSILIVTIKITINV